MGLLRAAFGAAGGVLADQWLDYFHCEAIPETILALKGKKRQTGRTAGVRGEENVISDGSAIAVADGQAMAVVHQGKIVDFCAEPGEYKFEAMGEPSVFAGGGFTQNALASLKSAFERFKFGGRPGRDTRIYYFNMKELVGNKYGTPNPVPFRVIDRNIGLDIDIAIRCFGEYSYRLVNPLLFYANVCGNVGDAYPRESLDGQLKSELLTALQPAFARIGAMGIRYSMLPGHTRELSEALNDELSLSWRETRGIEIAAFGVSSVKASEEDEAMIKELQRTAALRDPSMAAAHLVGAQADAMRGAARNEGAGPAMAFMGLNLAAGAGAQASQILQNMPAPAPAPAAAAGWDCPCGHAGNAGKFCVECGKPQPEARGEWACACGHAGNAGKFCAECGKPRPEPAKCAKCGFAPEGAPPKFCPECGEPFAV